MRTSNSNDEFKRDVVHQITVSGYPVREVARRLGVSLELLGESGEHQLRNLEVFEGKWEQTDTGFSASSGAAGTDQRPDAAGDRRGSRHRVETTYLSCCTALISEPSRTVHCTFRTISSECSERMAEIF
jgi:transposase-like protein